MFGAQYLGSTQLLSERNPPPSTRMAQAQEAVDRVKVKQGMEQAGGVGGSTDAPSCPWDSGRAFLCGSPLPAPPGSGWGDATHDRCRPLRVHQEGQGADRRFPGTGHLRRVPGWTRSNALSPSGLSLQEALMDHALQTVSYTADIGPVLVLMARRRLARSGPQNTGRRLYRMICHVFHAEDVSPGWGAAP